jgi:hypothetical protein
MTPAELAAMTSAERLRICHAYDMPPELQQAWRAITDDTYDRMTASACNAADCLAVEARP